MLQLNFTPFPQIATERLLLRRLTLSDAPEIFFLRSDKSVLQFLGKEPSATISDAEKFINKINLDIDAGDIIMWGIVLKEQPDTVIGTINYWRLIKEHYRAEFGYALHPSYWGKGIMKEAILEVLQFGFNEMKLHSIEARIAIGNIASASVLEATGFVKEAYFKEDFFFRGKFEDTIVYSLLSGTEQLLKPSI